MVTPGNFRIEGEMDIQERELRNFSTTLAGIAHDYNNINNVILGNLSLAKHYIEPNHAIYSYLSAAEEGVQHAKELSEILLTYTKESKNKTSLSLSKIIQETSKFLLRNSKVKVLFDLPEKELIINGFEVGIRRIINNIILNAEQSMPNGGTIRISACKTYLSDDNLYLLSCGDYAKITIEDEGVGIPAENVNKIFNQNYTTKNNGQGLGLSICLSIVKKHMGHISVSSEIGKGAKFEIFLPT